MASGLEHYVNTVTSLTAQANYNELLLYVFKSLEVLSKYVSHLDNVLATLEPATHTLGLLAVLKVRLQHTVHNDANIDTIHATVAEFVSVCSEEQIKLAPDLMAEMCQNYTDLLIAGKCPMRGIEVLKTAILKTRESPFHLSSIHAHLAHLCLSSKCLKSALHFLDVDYIDISKETQNGFYDVKHFLLYYYYGGMIYAALKRYRRAQYFFQVCISTPALAVSHVMLEAFKKYVLVSLILDGKVDKMPKHASLVVCRFIKPLSSAYLELGSAYATNNPDELTSVVNKNQEIYSRDQNLGLVKQCVHAMYKMNIQRLTKTFLTLSLADVANRVHLNSPQQAQQYILNMIDDGEIDARINQRDGMVVFLDRPEKYNSPEMLKRLHDQIEMSMTVERQISAMEEEILVNPQYVQKVLRPHDEDGGHIQPMASTSQATSSSRPI